MLCTFQIESKQHICRVEVTELTDNAQVFAIDHFANALILGTIAVDCSEP